MVFLRACALRFLANAVAAKASLQVAVRLLSPNQSFSQHLLHHLEAAGSLVPSASSMYRHRLTLTLAWFMYMQEVQASKENISTYFMVDSSPQRGADLLQHICMMLSDTQLLDAFQMSLALHLDPAGQMSQTTMEKLASTLKWEQGPAVGVGSGKAGLFYKLHALLHSRRFSLCFMGSNSAKASSPVCPSPGTWVWKGLFASIRPFPLASLIPWSATATVDFNITEENTGTFDFPDMAESSAMHMIVAPEEDEIQYHTGKGSQPSQHGFLPSLNSQTVLHSQPSGQGTLI